MPADLRPWRRGKDGLRVVVRVTPRAARDHVEGVTESAEGAALKVRVRAVADKGQANRAAEAAVAEWLGVARSSVMLSTGSKSRIKMLDVAGDPSELETLIAARIAAYR